MGTWEITNFGNDSALDWVNEFTENPTILFLNETIQSVFEDDYLEVDAASEALAAIEVIAAAKGHPSSDFPEEIEPSHLTLLVPSIDGKLLETCKKALGRITELDDSELLELWEDTDQVEEWKNVQKDLLTRLA